MLGRSYPKQTSDKKAQNSVNKGETGLNTSISFLSSNLLHVICLITGQFLFIQTMFHPMSLFSKTILKFEFNARHTILKDMQI